MTQKVSIEHVQSAAMVGKDIALWGAGRSLELAFKSTEFALSIANRGIGRVVQRGKQTATDAREASKRAFLSGGAVAQENVLRDYEATVTTTHGLLETSQNDEVIKAAKEINGRAAKTLADFYINHDVAVDLPTWHTLTNQVMEGGFDSTEIDHIHERLAVRAPITQIVSGEPGLENYVGSIDPTIPHQLRAVPDGFVVQQRPQ